MDDSRLQLHRLVFLVARRLRWEMDEVVAGAGLTVVQYLVLMYLVKHDGRDRQRNLRDFLRVEAPSLTGLLQRMERDGLIERNRQVLDRRNQEILISARGRELHAKLAAQVDTHSEGIFSRLSETEITALQVGLTALGRVLGQSPEGRSLRQKEKPAEGRRETNR